MSYFNFNGLQSPPRRPLVLPSPTSPFCTSPSQLQEVTLDQDVTFSNSMGLRSPGGPMRGRSVKEFEEQLSNLKKENFNLKLRIYFLEERMGANFNLDKEDVVKKNVELMVEVESLRKELQEKHDLLCQAVKAMELEDEEHKKILGEKDKLLTTLERDIETLKSQLFDTKQESDFLSTHRSYQSTSTEHFSSQDNVTIKELQEKIDALAEELNQEKENSAAISLILDQKDSKITTLLAELEEAKGLVTKSSEDKRDLQFRIEETKGKYIGLTKKLQEKSHMVDELKSEVGELQKRMALLNEDLERERRRGDRLRVSSELKVAELQTKLEASHGELKKSQELVVSKSEGQRSGYTDPGSFSVQKPTTPSRSAKKDSSSLSTNPSPTITPLSSPSTSRHFDIDGNTDYKMAIQKLVAERDAQRAKIVKLKAEQMKACDIIKSMIDSRNKSNDEIGQLKKRNEELLLELEGVVSKPENAGRSKDATPSLPVDENSMAEGPSGELLQQYKILAEELEQKNQILTATLTEKDVQMKKIQDHYGDILKNLKQKEDLIVDLEFELLSVSQEKKGNTEELYQQQLKEKNEEIAKLNEKLAKRNCDLQSLVNKELWEKNREIEKLKTQGAKFIEAKDLQLQKLQNELTTNQSQLAKLQNDLTTKDSQLTIIKEKISELGIDIDIQNGDIYMERDLQSELENSEKLRMETSEVCTVLSRRLEELAMFLDSLLKQKSVLGFLGNKEKRLRQLVDQSLDLSRSFTVSMLLNPDQSLAQLSNITSILDDSENGDEASRLSLMPSNVTLTFQSHLYKKSDEGENQRIIEALRQQIVNLKCELQLRDVELSKIHQTNNFTDVSSAKDEEVAAKSNHNTTSTTLKYKTDQSDSEAWSEPDRSVSRARMGIIDGSIRTSLGKKVASNSSETTTENEEEVSSRSKKGGLLNESRSTILELHKEVCELDHKLKEKEMAYVEALQLNKHLKEQLELCESNLIEAEAKRCEAENKVHILNTEQDELITSIISKDTEYSQKIEIIKVEKEAAITAAKEAEEVATVAKNELKAAEVKLRTIQMDMRELETNLREEYEKEIVEKIETMKKETEDNVRKQAEVEIAELQNTIERLRADYSANYVEICKLEKATEEINKLENLVDEMKEKIDDLELEGRKTKDKLAEYEERINNLRGDLDNATLQYSEAVLDKTKIADQRTYVEQEYNRVLLSQVNLKRQLKKFENELRTATQCQSTLQHQKSKLEVRVSELESSNAELYNRLIKIQVGCGDHVLSTSLPNTTNFVNQIVSFRRQHSDNSGYLSEDHLLDDIRVGEARSSPRLIPIQNEEERHEANSSPDLGIESDHGRFSSLETHLNVPRPLLQTLELTESMSNLLDGDNNQVESCDNNEHCCQKTQQMADENIDLKRKLLRTRRALEETVTQLTLANQRKKQVEKTICKQIHKTSQVLRKAKANLDSGSETDVYKK